MKQKISILIAVLMVMTACVGNLGAYALTAQEKEEDRIWKMYYEVSAEKTLAETQKALKKYPVSKYPGSVDFLAISGLCYYDMKKYNDAEKAGLAIVKSDKKYAMGPYVIGLAQYGKKQYDNAEKSMLKVIALDKTFSAPYSLISEIAAVKKQYNKAATNALKAVMIDPENGKSSVIGQMTDTTYSSSFFSFSFKVGKNEYNANHPTFVEETKTVYESDPTGMFKTPGKYWDICELLANEIIVGQGTADESYIAIGGQIFDKKSECPDMQTYAQNTVEGLDSASNSNVSDITTVMIGKQEFRTFTNDLTLSDGTYKAVHYITVRDGTVLHLTAYASTETGLANALKIVSTFGPYIQ